MPPGKALIVAGLVLIAAGLAVSLAGHAPWLGRLPGDITIRRENFTFHFPLTTCLIASVLITIVLYLFRGR